MHSGYLSPILKQLRDQQVRFAPRKKKLEQVEKDSDRDHFMDAEMAVAYGLIDPVLTTRVETPLQE